MFIGIGYDVHRFKPKTKLFLGGVRIIYKNGLSGHSDADVIIHALMDAMLGAAGLRDIGTYFPNTDPRFKNISSLKLLKIVVSKLKSKNLIANNVDIAVIAEAPKIADYIPKMKQNISRLINIPASRIGIKASTNEKLGFIGRNEGIAAIAIATLKTVNS